MNRIIYVYVDHSAVFLDNDGIGTEFREQTLYLASRIREEGSFVGEETTVRLTAAR